jgi:cyclophilin family peptidyl-prolyl cis-trans isomerase
MQRHRSTVSLLLLLLVAACGPSPDEPAGASAASADGAPDAAGDAASRAATPNDSSQPSGAPLVTALVPLPGLEDSVPTITRVTNILFRTTGGDVTIAVYPEAAPNAAKRFVELVESGYFDNTPVSRVVPGFVAQFGVNWRTPHNTWRTRTFQDDPTLFALERGTLAFAKAGPNTNSTQVFINYAENNRLAEPQYNFTTFGVVTSGMDVVDAFVQVGDPSGGLDQARLWSNGDAYLASLPEQPTMIVSAAVL